MSSCTSAACAVSATNISLACHVHCGGGGVSAAGGGMGAGHPGSLSAYWYGCAAYRTYDSSFTLSTTASSGGMSAYSNIPNNVCCFECGNFTENYLANHWCYWPDGRCSAGTVQDCYQSQCTMMAFTGFTNTMVGKTVYVEALFYHASCYSRAALVAGYLTEGVGFCSYPHCFNCCLNNFDSFQTIDIGREHHVGEDGCSSASVLHSNAYNRICRQGNCSHSHAGRLQRILKHQNCLFIEPKMLREVYVYNVE